ncbi:hypothetical protein [Spirosoma aerophilum]
METQLPEDLRYVYVESKLDIRIDDTGRITFVLIDADGKPINPDLPFVFSHIPNSSNVKSIRLLNAELYAAFTKESFLTHQDTLLKIDPTLTSWDKAELPNPETMPEMNPIGPPHTN